MHDYLDIHTGESKEEVPEFICRNLLDGILVAWFEGEGAVGLPGYSDGFIYEKHSLITKDMNGTALDAPTQAAVDDALKIANFASLPTANQEILNYLFSTILPSQNLEYKQIGNGFGLEGTKNGTGAKQCKDWLQNSVINNATGVTIPKNADDVSSAEWISNKYQIGEKKAEENFEGMFDRVGAQGGDVIQMYGNEIAHTMVIGKIQSDGIWVFDTNFGLGDYVPTTQIDEADYITNDGQNWSKITPEEKTQYFAAQTAGQKTPFQIGYWQIDDTVRYHFLTFDYLNSHVETATVQRIEQTTTVA